ncbi:integrase arm-type DNA-binding domain-containing protein [Sphingomonas sp. PP-CC-3G-468]|uniref:tyrosine-type recombinase/integrase n=1 Tax=Sphingomonas sp. PP-CC-3G-468 TaxID=2135656 RepID=UPI0010486875|nr:integrase arm-type DNA-binding domain-containing protein [Sphingomonas sp. PP-CC-3G-468]TCM08319.1 phage integrase family protein [Sphingomonas sp. PP-CC-3G-468]
MARKQLFTDKTITALHSDILSDPLTDGLSIEAKAGSLVWRYHRRIAGTAAAVRLRLGAYPLHSIACARLWAAGLNTMVEQGIDPREAQKASKAAGMALEAAWNLYWSDVQAGVRKVLKPRTLADKKAAWLADIKPYLGETILSEITADDLWQIVERKSDTAPVRANRLAAELKVIWSWFSSRAGQRAGIRLSNDASSSLSGKHYTESKGRTRILSEEEIGWFAASAAIERPAYHRALILMLLTGCRFSEVVEARRGEYRDGVWTVPATRTKNGKAHAIMLGGWGRELFEQATGQWLAPNRAGGLVEQPNWYRVRDRVHARMEALAGRPLHRWGFHDLRRTMRSNTFRLGIRYEVAEAMLNHSRTGLERRYDVGDLSDYTGEGFARWEALVASLGVNTLCDTSKY